MLGHRAVITIILIFLLSCLTGCKQTSSGKHAGTTAQFPVTVEDSLKRTVSIEKPPQRIVSLAPSNTEIVFALHLGDRLEGVTNCCDYPPEASKKPVVGNFFAPSVEKVLERQPDLVLAALGHEQLVNALEKRGIAVLVIEPVTVADVLEKIKLVGRVTGEAETAVLVTGELDRRIISLTNKVRHLPENEKPKVFYELWHEPLTTAGAGTFIDDLIKLAGGVNVAAAIKKSYPEFSLESLLVHNPDVLIHTYKHGGGDPSKEEIRSRKGWQNLNFVRNDRIYAVDADLVNRPGPRIVDGLEQFTRAVHPEIFGQ